MQTPQEAPHVTSSKSSLCRATTFTVIETQLFQYKITCQLAHEAACHIVLRQQVARGLGLLGLDMFRSCHVS